MECSCMRGARCDWLWEVIVSLDGAIRLVSRDTILSLKIQSSFLIEKRSLFETETMIWVICFFALRATCSCPPFPVCFVPTKITNAKKYGERGEQENKKRKIVWVPLWYFLACLTLSTFAGDVHFAQNWRPARPHTSSPQEPRKKTDACIIFCEVCAFWRQKKKTGREIFFEEKMKKNYSSADMDAICDIIGGNDSLIYFQSGGMKKKTKREHTEHPQKEIDLETSRLWEITSTSKLLSRGDKNGRLI